MKTQIEMTGINNEIKEQINHFISIYRDELTSSNLGDALHLNLSTAGIHAEDENEFRAWEQYALSLL